MDSKMSTRIACLIDQSGSMQQAAASTIEGFNGFINKLKEQPGECKVSLTLFDTNFNPIATSTLAAFPPLTKDLYKPHLGGATALLDAQGRLIDELGKELKATPENERPGKVIVMTMTDGLENASRFYTHGKVREMIELQREIYKWEFIYLGANQDAIAVGESMGISRGMSMNYSVSDPEATVYSYTASANMMNNVRSNMSKGISGQSVSFNADDRNKAMGGDSSLTGPNPLEEIQNGLTPEPVGVKTTGPTAFDETTT